MTTCKQCNSEMIKTKLSKHNYALQVLGVLLFMLAIPLLFFVPIGTAVGLMVMVSVMFLGYSSEKVWMCKNCGYYFNRG